MGRWRNTKEQLIERFQTNHGRIATEMLMKYDKDPSISTGKIARKIGSSRQNVHQLLTRLEKRRPRRIVRPWGRERFIPEVEALLRYLYNRFDGDMVHLGGRQFKVNGKKIYIMRRNYYHPSSNCLNINTSHYLDKDSADFKVLIHAGQVFILPFSKSYLSITDMPLYHNNFDLLG